MYESDRKIEVYKGDGYIQKETKRHRQIGRQTKWYHKNEILLKNKNY